MYTHFMNTEEFDDMTAHGWRLISTTKKERLHACLDLVPPWIPVFLAPIDLWGTVEVWFQGSFEDIYL